MKLIDEIADNQHNCNISDDFNLNHATTTTNTNNNNNNNTNSNDRIVIVKKSIRNHNIGYNSYYTNLIRYVYHHHHHHII